MGGHSISRLRCSMVISDSGDGVGAGCLVGWGICVLKPVTGVGETAGGSRGDSGSSASTGSSTAGSSVKAGSLGSEVAAEHPDRTNTRNAKPRIIR